ncbi:SMI1/KNR4 family protein [Nocardiopsis terrae]
METTMWSGVRERVEALARTGRTWDVLGAWDRYGGTGHHFRLAAPLSEPEVTEAETRWGVSLPEDYRGFLLQVGAGGAGPGYGLSTLHRTGTGWEWTDVGGETRHEALTVAFPTSEERVRRLAEHEAREPTRSGFATREAFEAAYRVWRDADDELFDTSSDGAVCLSHEGCGHCLWLVVTGPERGSMWVDGFSADGGFRPLGTPHERVGFADWYLDWVIRAETAV